jgi:DNA-binding beta-propeller fold protein YncE
MGIIVGSDSIRFEVAVGWGDLPAGYEWGQIADVICDADDRVYMVTRTEHPLMIFDRDGRFLDSLGEGLLRDPHGLNFDAAGNFYVVDRGAQVVRKTSRDGTELLRIGDLDRPSDTGWTKDNPKVLRAAGPFNYPTGVAIMDSGTIYVSDGYRNARVHKFDAQGKLLLSWGEPGVETGQFNLPHCVWQHKGKLYVADRENNRIQIFKLEGEYQATWTDVIRPADIYVDANDIMYVAELSGRVTIFNLNGEVLARIGSPSERVAEPGKFIGPHGIWADRHGDLYVSEVLNGQRIQKFIRI